MVWREAVGSEVECGGRQWGVRWGVEEGSYVFNIRHVIVPSDKPWGWSENHGNKENSDV